MRLPVLEENYVTFKLINQDNKNQLLSENSIIDKPISILDLMRLICNSEGVGTYDSTGTIKYFGIFHPEVIFNDDKLFMFGFVDYKNDTKLYFVSAKSYDEAYYIVKTWTSDDYMQLLVYSVEITPVDSKNGSITLSFGISAKAQAINKGKKVTTTFETTKLKTFFDKYIQANNFEKYVFYNNLYHGLTSTAEMQYLRRKYAAEALLDAITGSNQGENVLFLQYLDSLVRLDEFFELLAFAPQNQLPSLSIVGANKIKTSNDFVTRRGEKLNALLKSEGYTDLTPESKSLVA